MRMLLVRGPHCAPGRVLGGQGQKQRELGATTKTQLRALWLGPSGCTGGGGQEGPILDQFQEGAGRTGRRCQSKRKMSEGRCPGVGPEHRTGKMLHAALFHTHQPPCLQHPLPYLLSPFLPDKLLTTLQTQPCKSSHALQHGQTLKASC